MQTVDRALQALDLFSPLRPELSVADVARELGVDRSIASRLAALQARSYLAQEARTGRFRLGIRTLELGSLYLQQDRLSAAAVPHLEALARRTDGVANLFVLRDGDAIRLAAYPARPMTGIRVPAHCTAAGKVLLAALDGSQLDALLARRGLPPSTPRSITDRRVLQDCLEGVRRAGVAREDEERNLGRGCLAAPVRDVTGRVVAAVSVSWPIGQLAAARRPELEDAVREAALQVSEGLGPGALDGAEDRAGSAPQDGRGEAAWNGAATGGR